MKLWDKGYSIDQKIEQFTVGNDRLLDLRLAKYDVIASRAHAKMLARIGILTSQELEKVLSVLAQIAEDIEADRFSIEDAFEDMHSKIEFLLISQLGDTGKKIHTARSRNDQVLVALHLYAKEEIQVIKTLMKALFDTFIHLSEQYQHVIIPGYTHLQVAMPSSIGLWLSAYAESLVDDLILLNAAYKISDQNPLGSAAGYGTSFPIDRTYTTELLDFEVLKYNVVAAQMSRGKLEKSLAFAMASAAGTLGKFAMDACLYMSQNFGFITFPKELTTGSSIMPHKQNPDVFELIRAKCNQLQALPVEITMVTGNLPSGYHRDLQVLKEGLLLGIDKLKDCLAMCTFMLTHLQVEEDIAEQTRYQYMYTVEEVNKLVLTGMSFREAYQHIGREIAAGNFQPTTTLNHTHEGSLGNLCLKEIQAKFMKYYEEGR
ncbi:MAG: argininosuccinate lyase [Thermonemataceae bacterium]